jgi:hypothetical protein
MTIFWNEKQQLSCISIRSLDIEMFVFPAGKSLISDIAGFQAGDGDH